MPTSCAPRRAACSPTRAGAFAANFAEQWLQTRRLTELAPDPKLFPDFDEALRSAMIRETRLFCRSIQDEDRSILDIIDAADTFVNERLARHYGLAGVSGDDFRRVSLASTPRRGILTQASILAVTSNPTRTSPVKRGKWILENLLGMPPAPPPSGVEALKEDGAVGSGHALRERMERHRNDPDCASCHGRMDPLGFALESFDAVGAWRSDDDGRAIDDSGRLPAGREFRGPEGLRAVLRTRRDAFARCLAEKMLTYALGRGLDRSDRRAVRPDRLPPGARRIPVLRPRAGDRREPAIPRAREARRTTMRRTSNISRRTALKGLGVSIALPILEAMRPGQLRAGSADRADAPLRVAFVYVPNGVHMPDWTPRALAGAGLDLPPILEPLRAVKDDVLVLSGLTLNPARALGDGGGDHARAMASFLTGRHPRKTDGADLQAGISVDQLAAREVGSSTRFPSLELGCEGGRNAGECDHGYSCAYQSNLSWRGDAMPVAKQINPRLVFDRLLGVPPGVGPGVDPDRADRRRKSVLDFVREDARRIGRTLGAPDRRKLDEYLSGLRDVERRIDGARPTVATGGARMPRPLGIPADYREHLRLMADLLALAFQCDLTRVATFVFANDGSNRSYPAIGVPDGHHDLSHHGGDPAKQQRIRTINRFHVEQLAYLLEKLKSIPEGTGSLLDHCLIVYGSGISDGNAHNHEDLPMLVAGRANGTVRPGRHVRYARETPLTNLYVSTLERLGIAVNRFGDSAGPLTGLER